MGHVKGMPAWNKGIPLTKESIEKRNATRRAYGWFKDPAEFSRKQSIARKGKGGSPEHMNRIRQIAIITQRTPEYRKKMSERFKGRISPMKGKPNIKLSGSRSRFWKGGITPLVNKIRNCLTMKNWGRSIFLRDDFRCQKCGRRGGDLHADHFPVSFSKIFKINNIQSLEDALNCEAFWDVENGRTLCIPCHRGTDTYGTG